MLLSKVEKVFAFCHNFDIRDFRWEKKSVSRLSFLYYYWQRFPPSQLTQQILKRWTPPKPSHTFHYNTRSFFFGQHEIFSNLFWKLSNKNSLQRNINYKRKFSKVFSHLIVPKNKFCIISMKTIWRMDKKRHKI